MTATLLSRTARRFRVPSPCVRHPLSLREAAHISGFFYGPVSGGRRSCRIAASLTSCQLGSRLGCLQPRHAVPHVGFRLLASHPPPPLSVATATTTSALSSSLPYNQEPRFCKLLCHHIPTRNQGDYPKPKRHSPLLFSYNIRYTVYIGHFEYLLKPCMITAVKL